MKNIPLLLIAFRFLLAPVIIFLAYHSAENSRFIILILIYLGLLSDIFDGIIARKLGVSTEKLRRLDSQTDLIFWISVAFSTWLLFPDLIEEHKTAAFWIFGMEALCYVFSFLKFGKETCTHAFLSKMWGLSLLIAFTSLLGFQHSGFPFYAALVLEILSHLDVILIILFLTKWQHDIPSCYHAWQIRNGVKIKRNKYLNG